MVIEVTFDVTDVYISTTVSPVYINVSFEAPAGGGGAEWGDITGTLSNQTDLQSALDAKVPYTGATQDVSLGEYGINVGNVIYDTTPTGIPTDQGATYWDDQAETVALVMNGTIQKIGEDTFYHVKNSTGSTIAKGVAVRFAGTDGGSGKILIAPFLANGTYPTQYYMGITAEAITNGSNGKVYHFGKIRGVNTSAFSDGDILYCSTSVAGGFQTTAPSAPNNIVIAAAVINAGNNGTLMVRTTTGSNINTDEGVLITSAASGQVLKYNGSLWVNDSVSGALGYTPANAATTLTINGVTYDLSANRSWTIAAGISGSGASGQVAYWDGTSSQSGSGNLAWNNTFGRLGIGFATPASILHIVGSISTTPVSRAVHISSTIVASANNDTLIGLDISPSFTNSSFTGLDNQALRVTSTSVSATGDASGIGAAIATFRNNRTSTAFNPVYIVKFTRQNSGTASWYFGNDANNNGVLSTNNSALRIGKDFGGTYTEYMRMFSTGNLLLQNGGTFNDSGERLQVTGDVKVVGSGDTQATFAMRVRNSANNIIFSARNDSRFFLGSTLSVYPSNNSSTPVFNGIGMVINSSILANQNIAALALIEFDNIRPTAGTSRGYFLNHTFAPTSGTATYSACDLTLTINQTGGANGITRGLYVNPTLTAAADWRSIEWSNNSGWGLYGAGTAANYLAGNLLLGASTPNTGERLQVTGTMKVTGYSLFGSGNSGTPLATLVDFRGGSDADYIQVARVSTSSDRYVRIYANGQIDALSTKTDSPPFTFAAAANANTSGARGLFGLTNTFNPTSGTATYTTFVINQTINQTGGANGITRGLYVNPTLTAAADFRAIETTNGKVIFGNLPTSSAGLPTGAIWNNGGVINIV